MASPFAATLPVARYRFTAKLHAPLRLPNYAGSLLRGQFGAALRDVACMTRQPSCGGCPLLQTCPYTRIFEAPAPPTHALQKFNNIPNAYVVEPPPLGTRELDAGQRLVFHMVLAGGALAQLALVVFAWQRALAQGLTRARSVAELESVAWVDEAGAATPVWTHEAPVIAGHEASLRVAAPASSLGGIALSVHTPLRLQSQGHPLRPEQLTPRALIAAVARRAALMMEFHAGLADWGPQVQQVVELAQTLSDTRDLRWQDWTRYSSRQQQEMTLGGVLGRWSLHGPSPSLVSVWPWLWLGQWLHVGKNATMGMGAYNLEGTFQ